MQGRNNISHMPRIRGKLPFSSATKGFREGEGGEGRGGREKVRTVCPFMAA